MAGIGKLFEVFGLWESISLMSFFIVPGPEPGEPVREWITAHSTNKQQKQQEISDLKI